MIVSISMTIIIISIISISIVIIIIIITRRKRYPRGAPGWRLPGEVCSYDWLLYIIVSPRAQVALNVHEPHYYSIPSWVVWLTLPVVLLHAAVVIFVPCYVVPCWKPMGIGKGGNEIPESVCAKWLWIWSLFYQPPFLKHKTTKRKRTTK